MTLHVQYPDELEIRSFDELDAAMLDGKTQAYVSAIEIMDFMFRHTYSETATAFADLLAGYLELPLFDVRSAMDRMLYDVCEVKE